MDRAPELLAKDVRIIDLGADFRLSDTEVFAQWYGMAHRAPAALAEACYGLPEYYRAQVSEARLVANPGCYPTAVILGFAPLLAAGLLNEELLIADCKSGVSGAGRRTGRAKHEPHVLAAGRFGAGSCRAIAVTPFKSIPYSFE